MKTIIIILLLTLNPIAALCQIAGDSSKYYLVLESGETINGDSKYETPFWGKARVKMNEKEFTLAEVKQVICSEGYFMKYYSEGVFSIKEILVKRTTEGKIDLYSDYVTSYSSPVMGPNGTSMGGFPFTTYEELYFSKDKIKLLPIDYSNLIENLNDNPESVEYLKKYNTLRYFKYGLAAVGLITIIAGIAQFNKEEGLSSGAKSTIIIGGVIGNLAWIPHLLQGDCLKDAIKVYNE